MSHHSYFAMVVFDRRDAEIKGYLQSDAFASLLGIATAPSEPEATDVASLRRYMSGLTRSDWVKVVSRTLLDAAGSFDSLRFMSEETYTHREFIGRDGQTSKSDAENYGDDLQFTLFDSSEFETVIADIERFIHWCANNVPLVVQLIESDGEAGVLAAVYHTPASDKPTHYGDEGQGIHCLLSAFKAVRELLLHAGQRGLCAVYVNHQYTSREWYRKFCGLRESDAGYDGKLHENEHYVRPAPSDQPLLPFPVGGLPIDVPAMMSGATAEVREQAKMIRPYWADGDDIDYLFKHAPTLLSSGRAIWAAVIQANSNLFEPIYRFGAGGEVIYDPTGRMSPEGLAYQARYLFSLKGNQYTDGRLKFFSDYLADERTRVFGEDITLEGYPLKVSSTYFDQLYMPDGMLTLFHLPVLVSDDCPGAVMVLPCQFWPPALVAQWMEASDKKFGMRHDARELRAKAVAKYEISRAQFEADPAPLNLHGPSLFEEGVLYYHGRGVPQDLAKARSLWEKAARMGHPESMNNLGVIYSDGVGVAKNMRTALAWYQLAADKGHPLGQLNLGKMHLRGEDIEINLALAQFWLEQAARQGSEEAKELLIDYGLNEQAETNARGLLGKLLKKWFH